MSLFAYDGIFTALHTAVKDSPTAHHCTVYITAFRYHRAYANISVHLAALYNSVIVYDASAFYDRP